MSDNKKYCLKCHFEVESDDNFCPKCGHWTAKGYKNLTEQPEKYAKILNGKVTKKWGKIQGLFILLAVSILLAAGMIFIRGQDILKPITYIKREIMSYKYGYNATIFKTNNEYFNENISDYDDAIKIIENDLNNQKWQCKSSDDMNVIENELQVSLSIPSVSFCDISIKEAKKISTVIKDMYTLFPNIKGYLTNISVTNPNNKEEFVANFQPIYTFVNSSNNIDAYNRVNKTQILLNSYYFLNSSILNKNVKNNWYVSDASWESLIAHELGHYITFVALLKTYNVDSVLLVTKENKNIISNVLNIINSSSFADSIIRESIDSYNLKYGLNLSKEEFAGNISKYAKDAALSDEIISESVHDYYLHRENAKKESLEVVNVLNSKLE